MAGSVDQFFEPPPPDPEPPPRPPSLPPWIGPPDGTLPGVLAQELVLARNDKVAVCLTRLAAYPQGFEVDLLTMSRAEEGLDPMLFRSRSMRQRPAPEGIPEDMLRFGIQFADGSKATNTGTRSPNFAPDAHPSGPVLQQRGGGGGGRNWRQTMWIWPLPPPGALTLVVEWPAAGVPLTRHEIDAGLILEAAARSQVIFPDEDTPGGGIHITVGR